MSQTYHTHKRTIPIHLKRLQAIHQSEVERLRGNYPTKGRGVIETRNLDKDTLLPKRGMKKGGDVKGWGSARGARKAKIY